MARKTPVLLGDEFNCAGPKTVTPSILQVSVFLGLPMRNVDEALGSAGQGVDCRVRRSRENNW